MIAYYLVVGGVVYGLYYMYVTGGMKQTKPATLDQESPENQEIIVRRMNNIAKQLSDSGFEYSSMVWNGKTARIEVFDKNGKVVRRFTVPGIQSRAPSVFEANKNLAPADNEGSKDY